MTLSDGVLILKKIIVGVILVLVPALLLWGGLQLTIKLLSPQPQNSSLTHWTDK
ncbi:hypothetical protein V9K67_17240 [Paraflavisolibacter sp. H34]|uniref:hypothetical protein n=1 Tax=Huijunlia imazamoxiresistens TaxID=3127457 RepID=UPI00301B07BB